MLTFDGNLKLDKKVTYEKIRQHLQEKYNRHFASSKSKYLVIVYKHRNTACDCFIGYYTTGELRLVVQMSHGTVKGTLNTYLQQLESGIIKLPSERTLTDYTHWTTPHSRVQ